MQNAAVAAVFDEIADLMELAGENSFKVRAYRRAAEAVAAHEAPIEDVAEAGELRSIEGLGEATSEKVREYLATGAVRYLDRLRDEYPAALLELMRVPGLGPKKVSQLYRERNISSIESLIQALDSNGLDGLNGFGPKTIENIRRGLARVAELTTRLPIGDAIGVADNVVAALRRQEAVSRVDIAGSLRRGCDTVGNLDFVAETDDAQNVVAGFTGSPFVLKVVEASDSGATICMRPGIEARLRCATPAEFGSVFFHLTGSAAHVEAARERAAGMGLELKPDGLYQAGKRIAGEDEASIYEALGVQFIEPELREASGEWEAAERSDLPNLITNADIRGDLHTHSTWSDGVSTIRQMAEAMRARGYSYFAVTDHSKALAMANGLNAERLRQQAKEIAEVQAEFSDLKILRGVECDIMRDGTLDLDDDILHELDFVVASVHSGFSMDEASQTERMIRALSHPAVDLVAHPTGRVLGARPSYDVNVNALIEAARDTKTALEINASQRLDLSDKNARAAREAGVLLCIDSDAHSPRMLPNVELGVLSARRAWCTAADVLNAKTTDELLQWIKR
jgi:DNA polymerase (family 10)